MQGPADPVEELLPGDARLAAAEDVGQGLLEQVGAVQAPVAALDEGHPLGLWLREVPRILLQREAGLLERGALVGAAQFANLLTAYLVESVVGEALNVEAEELRTQEGRLLNPTLLDYKIAAAEDMPVSESYMVDVHDPEGPFGAKEAGEGLVSPTAPAIADAVHHATGFRCLSLPITPEKIVDALARRQTT